MEAGPIAEELVPMTVFRRFFVQHQMQIRLGQHAVASKLRRDVVTRELTNAYIKQFPSGSR